MDETCPRIASENTKALQLPEIKRFLADNKDLFSILEVETGKSIESIEDVAFLYDTLKIEVTISLSSSEWAVIVRPVSDFARTFHCEMH